MDEELEFARYKFLYEELKARVQRLVNQADVFSDSEVFVEPRQCERCGQIFSGHADETVCRECRAEEP